MKELLHLSPIVDFPCQAWELTLHEVGLALEGCRKEIPMSDEERPTESPADCIPIIPTRRPTSRSQDLVTGPLRPSNLAEQLPADVCVSDHMKHPKVDPRKEWILCILPCLCEIGELGELNTKVVGRILAKVARAGETDVGRNPRGIQRGGNNPHVRWNLNPETLLVEKEKDWNPCGCKGLKLCEIAINRPIGRLGADECRDEHNLSTDCLYKSAYGIYRAIV
jgi:hypothetical protein